MASFNDIPYKICTSCIMDTSDPHIRFDVNGLCDYCNNFHRQILPTWHTNAQGAAQLAALAKKIKHAGRNKEFDCIIGLSGGLDSSYTAYVAKEKKYDTLDDMTVSREFAHAA